MTTHWNYRVVRREMTDLAGDTEVEYSVRETHYEDATAVGWSAEPSAPTGETVEELTDALVKMICALGKPVIEDPS